MSETATTNTIDSQMLAKMFLNGARNLEAGKEWINELNVFPVPDGDTGTNMTMTIMSAAKEVSEADQTDMKAICKCISSGSLRGARGNSGVILSQLLRGFTKIVRDHDFLTIPLIAEGFEKAVETAYKAVMKPKEGTILTVAKGAAEKAAELSAAGETDYDAFFQQVIAYAEEVLAKTPDMLPVLKQAGVVDSGGQGLVQVLKGAYDGFLGKEITLDAAASEEEQEAGEQAEELQFLYCTELIIHLSRPLNVKQEMDLKGYLESIGEQIAIVSDDTTCKVHVHSNDPGLVIQKALMYGELTDIKNDNLHGEHHENLFHFENDGTAVELGKEANPVAAAPAPAPAVEQPRKEMGFVAVCAGDGLAEIFRSLGADYVIEGGQTMNPSTADIVDAVAKVNAETVFILPNNKNIILAAQQAVYLAEDGKKIVVIPSKTIPQGITALINFMPDVSVHDNEESMSDAINHVASGEVTYAVRDTMIDDVQIHEGDYMGIADKGIQAVGRELDGVVHDMLGKIVGDETELISVYYGSDVTEDQAAALQERIQKTFPACDVELQYGGQPIYYYIVSAE